MIVFLDSLIVPFVRTARPRSILLAGGGDGSMITQLLSAGEPAGTVLHIADPAPAFDVSAIRQLAGDRVIVHRADAADVIGLVPVPDLLLLNADPNWYTTDRLLRAAAAQAARTRRPFPPTLLPNTGWPYARRDRYADPNAIPNPFRHPHERAGLHPEQAALCASFGLFVDNFHATGSNEPRNGVLTAAEDFLINESPRLAVATLPFLHGISLIYPLAEAGTSAVRWLLEAMALGPAARALAEATERARVTLAADNADVQRAQKAAQYRNDSLHTALRRMQLAVEPPRVRSGPLARGAARAERLAHRAARLALWSATMQLGARLAQERERHATEAAIARLRASLILDPDWYRTTYKDVAAIGEEPAAHYYHHGAAEGRDPGPYFSTAGYLARYSDVAESGTNPLLHYLYHGAAEGRDPGPQFSSRYYLDHAPDVAQAGQNPLEHYLAIGRAEGRRTGP